MPEGLSWGTEELPTIGAGSSAQHCSLHSSITCIAHQLSSRIWSILKWNCWGIDNRIAEELSVWMTFFSFCGHGGWIGAGGGREGWRLGSGACSGLCHFRELYRTSKLNKLLHVSLMCLWGTVFLLTEHFSEQFASPLVGLAVFSASWKLPQPARADK